MTDDTNNDDLIGWIIDLLDYKAGFKGELLHSDKDSFFLDKLCTLIKSNNDKLIKSNNDKDVFYSVAKKLGGGLVHDDDFDLDDFDCPWSEELHSDDRRYS